MNTQHALSYFDTVNAGDALATLYSRIPSGRCAGCTQCCSEAVNTFYSEYLNLSRLLMRQGLYKEKAIACIRYYLTELVQPMKCPLLEQDGRCAVYDGRPLPCRIFGHLDQAAYEENYDAILEANQEVAEILLTEFQITIPEAVVNRKIPYCEAFVSEQKMDADDQAELVDELFSLETKFLSSGLLEMEELNFSLVQWFAYEWLGEEKASEYRIIVSQEISNTGKSNTLEQIITTLETAELFENFGF